MNPIFSHAHSLLFKIGWFDTCANSCGRFKTPFLNDFQIYLKDNFEELQATSAQRIHLVVKSGLYHT